jgi:hypothetical protein
MNDQQEEPVKKIYTVQYKKKDGSVTTYEKGYIPKKRTPSKCVTIEKAIQSQVKELKQSKNEKALNEILEFINKLREENK